VYNYFNKKTNIFNPANPEAPGAPDINDWSQNHADLVWKKPFSDGGTPITHYIIEKKDKYRYNNYIYFSSELLRIYIYKNV